MNRTILSGNIGDQENAADNSCHVVLADGVDTTAVLDGFTITGGHANADDLNPSNPENYGGGLYNNSGSPSVTNCTFSGNTAIRYGGGVFSLDGSLTLTNCTFSGNSSLSAGGGAVNENGIMTVIRCTFSDNSDATLAGGLFNFGG